MLDLQDLRAAVAAHGIVVRVVVASVEGSAPREPGAAMVVWADGTRDGGQSGTIGGGALEWEAATQARAMLATGSADRVDRRPLGPALGQCCGGAVVLVSERWDAARLAGIAGDIVVRSPEGRDMPLAVKRLLDRARARGERPGTVWTLGWLVEPVAAPARHLWVWGAGHVGRAIVSTLAPLPGLAITWVDVARDRFPADVPPGVTVLAAADPAGLAAQAPRDAEHLILTFSHALDLDLCHRLLMHGFRGCGLIGSATKWARFRSRLAALGHPPDRIARIVCPIGDPDLGKHPQAIAIGVAAALLRGIPHTRREEIAG
ncbi:MAG TPA: xanthine dehydrogenase accessory protein XdhC [Paracoccaceae bacterium]|nr:xanthine dehydrogenase accessory protein XdhC [Paracoccaceae bacterium]HMO72350.1 xanthine dehydrogenase accessory protein XdhC [Paracoccaceae bacterium]